MSIVIYYPFIALALMIVSRSSLFDNFSYSVPILTTIGISLLFARQAREGRFIRAPRPDLILLDLELPKKGGRELLDDFAGGGRPEGVGGGIGRRRFFNHA